MKEELKILIEAKYPLIYLVTPEEGRSEQAILALAQTKPQRKLSVWTVTHGIAEYDQSQNTTQHSTVSPEAAIEWVIRQRDPSTVLEYIYLRIYILLLIHHQLLGG